MIENERFLPNDGTRELVVCTIARNSIAKRSGKR